MIRRHELRFALCALMASWCPSSALAVPFTFTRIADTSTTIPGSAGTFTQFGVPVIDGDHIAFHGAGEDSHQGVYLANPAGLEVLADTNLAGGFDSITADISISGANVAFAGKDTPDNVGVYRVVNGQRVTVADISTPVPSQLLPGQVATFLSVGLPSIDGTNVAFFGRLSIVDTDFGTSFLRHRVFHANQTGGLTDTHPQQAGVVGDSGPHTSYDEGQLVFTIGSQAEIYRWDGGPQPLNVRGRPVIGDGEVAYSLFNDIRRHDKNGNVKTLVTNTTPIPGGEGNFTRFPIHEISISEGNLAFAGEGLGGQRGLYAIVGGELDRVIGLGDSLDGEMVSHLLVGDEAISGDSITFSVGFENGSWAVYRADSPFAFWKEPVSGEFTEAQRWRGNEVPGATASKNSAGFDLAGGNYTVSFDTSVENQFAAVGAGEVTFDLDGHIYSLEGDGRTLSVGGTHDATLHLTDGLLEANPAGDGEVHVAGGINTSAALRLDETVLLRTNRLNVGRSGRMEIPGQLFVLSDQVGTVQVVAADRVEVVDGGTLISAQGFVEGTSEAPGEIRVVGSKWIVKGNLETANPDFKFDPLLEIGSAGVGRMTVEDGGAVESLVQDVTSGIPFVQVGVLPGAEGTVNVIGRDSSNNASRLQAAELTIGVAGKGTMLIDQGGEVVSNQAILGFQGPPGTAAEGNVTVSGNGSAWRVAFGNGISVGEAGLGKLEITDGALVETPSLDLGIATGGEGSVIVRGVGSKLDVSAVGVGVVGSGILQVREGAEVGGAGLLLEIGQVALGEGLVLVDGAGSRVDALTGVELAQGDLVVSNLGVVETPNLTIGPGSEVLIQSGGKVLAGGGFIAEGGQLTGDDGTFQALEEAGLLINEGTIAAGSSPGRLTIDANLRQEATGSIEFEFAGLQPDLEHDVLEVTKNVELNGTVVFKFIDGFAPQAGDQFNFLQVGADLTAMDVSYEIRNLEEGFEFDLAFVAGMLTMTATNDGVSRLFGDFNGNGFLEAQDIDLLTVEIRNGSNDRSFDLDGNELVNERDHAFWVKDRDVMFSYFGDANLDREFNSGDLVAVFAAGEYEDSIDDNSGWAEGDWDGDGDFTSGDLVLAFQDGAYEQGPQALVPEPNGFGMLMIASALLAIASTRRSGRRF